jgi:hypothetical protein
MVTVLVTSFLLLAAISYVFYCLQRASSKKDTSDRSLMPPPPRFRGLFDDDAAAGALDAATTSAHVNPGGITSAERETLRERARQSDKAVLTEAQALSDADLYDELLDALVERADSDKQLLALASYITRHQGLRVNRRLAEALIDSWRTTTAPDRGSTAKLLHVAALADDAALYRQAVETALQFWRERRITNLSAEELRTLAESEYWLLSAGVRSSGAGFVLKRRLAGLRRELAAAMTPIQ